MRLHGRNLEAASFWTAETALCVWTLRRTPAFPRRSPPRSPRSWLGTDPATWQPGSPGTALYRGGPGLSLLPCSTFSLSNSNASAAIFRKTLKRNSCRCLFLSGRWRDPAQEERAGAVGASRLLPIPGLRSAEGSGHHAPPPWGSLRKPARPAAAAHARTHGL